MTAPPYAPKTPTNSPIFECREILSRFHRYLAKELAPLGNRGVGAVIGSDVWRQTCLEAHRLTQVGDTQGLRRYLWGQCEVFSGLAKAAKERM